MESKSEMKRSELYGPIVQMDIREIRNVSYCADDDALWFLFFPLFFATIITHRHHCALSYKDDLEIAGDRHPRLLLAWE